MTKAVKIILWIIYIALLAVLLPHTAWAFQQFEPSKDGVNISFVAYAGAFAFEAAIAALTHKLSTHIEQGKRLRSQWAKFSYRYLNAYSVGLVSAIGISSLANLAHAVEFGQPMKIFTDWKIPFGIYAFVFGAILPAISLVFARVLSHVVEDETTEDPEKTQLTNTIKELRSQLRQSEIERKQAVERFEAIGDLVIKLFSNEKRDKILAASQLWPELKGTAIAIIADSSPAYVSEVLSEIPQIIGQ